MEMVWAVLAYLFAQYKADTHSQNQREQSRHRDSAGHSVRGIP